MNTIQYKKDTACPHTEDRRHGTLRSPKKTKPQKTKKQQAKHKKQKQDQYVTTNSTQPPHPTPKARPSTKRSPSSKFVSPPGK